MKTLAVDDQKRIRIPDAKPRQVFAYANNGDGTLTLTLVKTEPLKIAEPPGWDDIMSEIWQAQKRVKSSDRVPNPVLQERQRRRR